MNKINKIVIGGLLVVSGFIGGQKVGFEKMKSVYKPDHYEAVKIYDEGSLEVKDEHEVYQLNDNYDGIYYLPLKALKVNVYNEDYVILSNNEGSAFIAEGNIKENENYIGIVSYINNEEVLHSLIESDFKFSKNSEEAFNMKIWDNKVFFEREAVLLLNK